MNLVDNEKVLIDIISQSSYYVYQEEENIKQCWFESKKNLAFKIDRLLNEKEIGEVRCWYIGYTSKHLGVLNMVERTVTK